jgi:uncharacterized protein YbcI
LGVTVIRAATWGVIALSEAKESQTTTALAQITRGLAQLHTKYYGKGPTKARSYMVDDTVVCFLEGGFTTVERTLIDQGRSGSVHEIRHSFQLAMEHPFREVVEKATGRRVDAYMSQIHHDPDLAVELFTLKPGTASKDTSPAVGGYEEELDTEREGPAQ